MNLTNKRNPFFLCLFFISLALVHCTKQQKLPVVEPESDVYGKTDEDSDELKQSLIKKMDEIDTLDARDKSTEMYLLSLNSFMSMGTGDRRIPEMIMKKGDFFFEQSLFSDAIESYRIILTEYKDTPLFVEAMKKIAVAYARNGEMENAQTWYTQLRGKGKDSLKNESRNNSAKILFNQARGLTKNQEYEKAKKVYLKIVEKYPELKLAPQSLFSAGYMEQSQEKWAQAISLYGTFLQNYQESEWVAKVLYHEAFCWYQNGNYGKAAKKYLKVIKNFPASIEAEKSLFQAGVAFEKDNRLMLAGRTFEKYAELYPESKDVCKAVKKAHIIYQKSGIQENYERVKSKYLGKCFENSARGEP